MTFKVILNLPRGPRVYSYLIKLYRRESGCSTQLSIKTKHRSRLVPEVDTRVAIGKGEPRTNSTAAQEQEHRCHNLRSQIVGTLWNSRFFLSTLPFPRKLGMGGPSESTRPSAGPAQKQFGNRWSSTSRFLECRRKKFLRHLREPLPSLTCLFCDTCYLHPSIFYLINTILPRTLACTE